MRGDEKFESFLREFQPRRPRALHAVGEAKFEWRRWAAAAAVMVAVGTSAWFAIHHRHSRETANVASNAAGNANEKFRAPRLSLLSLTQMAFDDPRRLDRALTEESRRVLPDFRSARSTLRVLAKE